MILKAFRARKVALAVDQLMLEDNKSSDVQLGEIKRLVRELKLNDDEANLVFAYFWSHKTLLIGSDINNTQDFQIDFDNVKRLPTYFLKFANHPSSPTHTHPNEFYKGIIQVHADSRSGELSLRA